MKLAICYYSTANKLQAYLGITRAFTESTNPTVTTVEDIINQAEDKIDKETGHAWRIRRSGTETSVDTTSKYDYYDAPDVYDLKEGAKIYLRHRKIATLNAGEGYGDALEVWNGDSYINYLTAKTEGRGHDYWLDYDKGILYYYPQSLSRENAVRLKYRYGDDSVPRDIERCCTLMAAIDLITSEDRMVNLPGGDNAMLSMREKLDVIEKEIKKILESRSDYRYMMRS